MLGIFYVFVIHPRTKGTEDLWAHRVYIQVIISMKRSCVALNAKLTLNILADHSCPPTIYLLFVLSSRTSIMFQCLPLPRVSGNTDYGHRLRNKSSPWSPAYFASGWGRDGNVTQVWTMRGEGVYEGENRRDSLILLLEIVISRCCIWNWHIRMK